MNIYEALENARLQLYTNHNFYGLMLHRCDTIVSDRVPTAGVAVSNKGTINLYLNKNFFLSLSEEHRVGLLMHEMLHLFMYHIDRGKNLNHQIANMAMDIAINQYIPKNLLPTGALLPEQFKLDTDKAFEEYYSELVKNATVIKMPLDVHGLSEEGDGKDKGEGAGEEGTEMQKATVEAAISRVIQTANLDYGNMPKPISRYLEHLSNSRKKDWKSILRKFIGRNIAAHKDTTRTKPNRRMGFMAQGYKNTYVPKVLVAIDESGSVSDGLVSSFHDEIKKILQTIEDKTEIISFDTQVHHSYTVSDFKKVERTRKASGGTDFNCVFSKARESKPDLVVVLTDGGAPAPEEQERYKGPVLWAVAKGYSGAHLKGTVIEVDNGKE